MRRPSGDQRQLFALGAGATNRSRPASLRTKSESPAVKPIEAPSGDQAADVTPWIPLARTSSRASPPSAGTLNAELSRRKSTRLPSGAQTGDDSAPSSAIVSVETGPPAMGFTAIRVYPWFPTA